MPCRILGRCTGSVDLQLFMLLTEVIFISPRTPASLQSICARLYVLGGKARPKLMNCTV